MKQVNEMPTTGQFVAVWEYNGQIWSGIYDWQDDYFHEYDNHDDDWARLHGVNRTAWGYDPLIFEKTKFFVGE